MKAPKWFILMAIGVILAIMFTSCAPAATPAPAEPAKTEAPAAEPVKTEAPAAEPVKTEAPAAEPVKTEAPAPEPTKLAEMGGPQHGGTLRVGVYQDFTGLMPATGGGGWPLFVIQDGFYDPLLEIDESANLQPGLAAKWEFSEDNKTITMSLQQGVKFHDGEAFNADVVKLNLERYINPEAGVIWDLTPKVESVEVVDEYTVKIHLVKPDAAFLFELGQDPGMMISPKALEEMGMEGLSQHPVGTGPFMFESWEPGVELVMVKNPEYWREGLPYLDRIEWKILIDNTVRTIALTTDEIDIMTFVPQKDYESLKKDENLNLWTQSAMVAYVSLNMTDPPFNVKENREAFKYAVDYEALRDTVFYGLADIPTGGPFPPDMWSFNADRPRVSRDLAKAKEMLAAAGNPDGFSFDMTYEPDPIGQQTAEVIQANLAEVGITVNLQKYEFARFIEIMQTDRSAVQAMVVFHGRMRANPEQYFTADLMTNGSQAFNNWQNPELDAIVTEAMGTFDREKRLELMLQAEDMVIEDLPLVVVSYPMVIHATNARVQDFALHPWGELWFRWLWLKP